MIKYFEEYDKKTCYGCRACEQSCPQAAIFMKEDGEGFLYPILESEKCTRCGVCSRVCPYTNNNITQEFEADVYALKNREQDVLMKSTSGGAFSVIADYVLERSGYVVGCVFDDKFSPIHIIAEDSEGIAPMRGSKYVQSDTGTTYTQVQKLLHEDKWVLYTGTPCEIAGLRSYLRKNYDKLITVDLVCHGVPSPGLFRKYLDNRESFFGGKILEILFRDKKKYGQTSRGTIRFINRRGREKTKQISPLDDSYYFLFHQRRINRMCCYSCKFAQEKRVGDFTIADFWGIEEVLPSFKSGGGVSLVLVNTTKGKKIFDSITKKVYFAKVDLNLAADYNGNLRRHAALPPDRTEIFEFVNYNGYDATTRKYCKYRYVIPAIKRIIPKPVKKMVKSILKKFK